MRHSTATFWTGDDEWCISSPDAANLLGAVSKILTIDKFKKMFVPLLADARRVVDVGACIGTYSLLFHHANPDIEIIALEPSSHNYPYLLRNTSHVPQIKQYPLAASDKTETLTLSVPSMEQKAAHNKGVDNCGIISVYGDTDILRNDAVAIRLDDLVDTADLIKIDAEGHDYPILLGAQRLMAEERPIVTVEYSQPNLEMSGYCADDITNLFTKHRYVVIGGYASDFVFCPYEKVPEGMNKKQVRIKSVGKGFTARIV